MKAEGIFFGGHAQQTKKTKVGTVVSGWASSIVSLNEAGTEPLGLRVETIINSEGRKKS